MADDTKDDSTQKTTNGSEHRDPPSTSKPEASKTEARRSSAWASPILLVAALVGFGLYLYTQTEHITRDESHANRMVLALVSIGLFVAYLIVRRGADGPIFVLRGRNTTPLFSGRWWMMLVLAGACLWGVFNYYQNDRRVLLDFDSNQDAAYYYLNSKYFNELGYYELYPAMLLADQETDNELRNVRSYRNLSDYQMVGRQRANVEKERVVAAFAPERWESFKRDVDHIIGSWEENEKSYFFSDHGFNPPPTWSSVGGSLSDITPVEKLKQITMVDTYLVIGMFVLIGLTFGFDTLLFCALLFLCTYSGRWPVLGQSLLRFDWVVMLVCSVCMLRRGNWGLAGAFLAYSALNRIFPAIFFFPVAVLLVRDLIRERKLHVKYRRFIAGAAIMSMLLVGIAVAKYGTESFVQSKENLVMHNSAESYSRYRTGWGDALIYEGERTGLEFDRAGGISAKQDDLRAVKHIMDGTGLVTLLLIGVYAWRKKLDAADLLHLCIIPFFALTTPQINYFNLRLLLIMWHMRDPKRPENLFGIVSLLLIEFVVQASHVVDNDRYATTSLNSIGLSVYFAVVLVAMIASLVSDLRPEGLAARARALASRHAVVSAALGIALVGLTLGHYWRSGMDTGNAKAISGRRLARVMEDGTKWNAPGTQRIKPDRRIVVDFGKELLHEPKIDMSFDRNDIYHLRFYSHADHVGEITVTRDGDGGGGLYRKKVDVPPQAIAAGYNAVLVWAQEGKGEHTDTMFSVGHLVPIKD